MFLFMNKRKPEEEKEEKLDDLFCLFLSSGSPNSLSDEGPGGGEEGPPRASAGDVITLDDSLSPPPLPQQPVVTSMPSMLALEMSRNLVTSQPPELEVCSVLLIHI